MASDFGERTRWMGDAYQAHYRKDPDGPVKRLALVQTPNFVGEFLLDRTLTPALDVFPLEEFRMIDPSCGTGHLLCKAFDRLWDRWLAHAPDLSPVERARRVLAAVHGVDLDPLCVAVARLRLTVAACDAAGVLPYGVPQWGFRPQVIWGDSLLDADDPMQPLYRRHGALVARYGQYTTPWMRDAGEAPADGA